MDTAERHRRRSFLGVSATPCCLPRLFKVEHPYAACPSSTRPAALHGLTKSRRTPTIQAVRHRRACCPDSQQWSADKWSLRHQGLHDTKPRRESILWTLEVPRGAAMVQGPSCRPSSAVQPSPADSFYLRPWWAPPWGPLPLFYLMCHPIEALAAQVVGDWNEQTCRPPSPSSCVCQNPAISRPPSRRWAPPWLLHTLLPPFWASIGPLGHRTGPITAGQELLYVPAMDRTKGWKRCLFCDQIPGQKENSHQRYVSW
jgi:hypothetical protein